MIVRTKSYRPGALRRAVLLVAWLACHPMELVATVRNGRVLLKAPSKS